MQFFIESVDYLIVIGYGTNDDNLEAYLMCLEYYS